MLQVASCTARTIDEEEGEELAHEVRLELGFGAMVLPAVEKGGEAVEDVPKTSGREEVCV